MGLKPVELQIAIPRTGEAGHLQQQLLQKPVHDQAMLANEAAKRMEHMRKKSEATARPDEGIKTERDGQGQQQHKHHQRQAMEQADEAEKETVAHPYKGHHIDLTL